MDLNAATSRLRKASAILACHNEKQKNMALSCVAKSLIKNKDKILKANDADVEKAHIDGMKESMIDRLSLDEKKFQSIVDGINLVIQQQDPVGHVEKGWSTPNGMMIKQVRVPLGVVAIIYENRPNVTVDAFALAYKSGNSILLRGSSSALNSNIAISNAIREGLVDAGENGVPDSIYHCEEGSHEEVDEILNAVGKIDIVLPRGSGKFIKHVVSNSKIPVIETGAGVCHMYVDEHADAEMAAKIALNGKTQRTGVCNALECFVVHKNVAEKFLPLLAETFKNKVELHADEKSFSILENCSALNKDKLKHATDDDFGFEFLDYIAAVKTVDTIDDAIEYINEHNTKHSECIITESRKNAIRFQQEIDASCVYVNASTRFTDGGEFGFGAELGISTQKLHARGPMGASALTTTKYLIDGNGQIR